ncbi:MAG: hypothetical protein WC485_00130 [Opitutaceae bacterium]
MSAPTATARQFPSGTMLEDGYQTLVAFAADPSIELWEKTVQPPGIDGGSPIDTTTMINATWRSKAARRLLEMTDSQMSCGYDPAVYDSILALVNVETSITLRFPDDSYIVFYGFLQKFEPDSTEEGKMPEAKVTITVTNADPITGDEEPPVYHAPVGTGTAVA